MGGGIPPLYVVGLFYLEKKRLNDLTRLTGSFISLDNDLHFRSRDNLLTTAGDLYPPKNYLLI